MHDFERRLAQSLPLDSWREVGLLVAVSGGADSVALLRGIAGQAGGTSNARLAVAHFNHALRGAESDADEQFVRELAETLELPCYVERATGGGSLADPALEETARRQRYDFLRRTAEQQGLRLVATAHTADDQAETILHHVLRGTGLAGLAGMGRTRSLSPAATLIRPLLTVRRQEIERYLDQLNQPHRVDATNADVSLTRNRLRHELLPLLAERHNPAVVESLLRLGALAGEAQQIMTASAEQLAERAVRREAGGGITLNLEALSAAPRHLVRELFVVLWRRQGWPMQALDYAQWERLADLATGTAPSGAHALPGGVRARREGGQLCLERLGS